jgi:hypothetical protein
MKLLNYKYLLLLTLMLAACTHAPAGTDLINKDASLPASFDLNKMGLKVITSSINKKQGTMATLYGNAAALQAAKGGADIKPIVGETFALVTWKQKADEHWFGAKIPGQLQSLEMLKTQAGAAGIVLTYQKYVGKSLTLTADTAGNNVRTQYILQQQASVMP